MCLAFRLCQAMESGEVLPTVDAKHLWVFSLLAHQLWDLSLWLLGTGTTSGPEFHWWFLLIFLDDYFLDLGSFFMDWLVLSWRLVGDPLQNSRVPIWASLSSTVLCPGNARHLGLRKLPAPVPLRKTAVLRLGSPFLQYILAMIQDNGRHTSFCFLSLRDHCP